MRLYILIYLLYPKYILIKAKDFIFENHYKRIGFSKEKSYYSMKLLKKKDLLLLANKLIEKMPDPCNSKKHQTFIRKKHKISGTIRNNYLSTKNI